MYTGITINQKKKQSLNSRKSEPKQFAHAVSLKKKKAASVLRRYRYLK